MSERIVLRMTARSEEDVVLGRSGKSVLRRLSDWHSVYFLERRDGIYYSKDVITPLFLSMTRFCMRL